jgi:hypothetical protein
LGLIFAAQAQAGTLRVIVAGPGAVSMNPAGVHLDPQGAPDGGDGSQCVRGELNGGGPPCLFSYPSGTTVTLTAAPDPPAGGPDPAPTLARWSPLECFGAGQCTQVIGDGETVAAATFSPLSLTVAPVGNGSVSSNPPGIDCGNAVAVPTCDLTLPAGTPVTLTASSAESIQWPVGCESAAGPVCRTTVTSDPWWVFVQFGGAPVDILNRPPRVVVVLRVFKGGTGKGSVSGAKLDCGAACSAQYEFGTPERLVAAAAAGSTFARWEGACATDPVCVVPAGAVGSVRAVFDASPTSSSSLPLTGSKPGSGPAGPTAKLFVGGVRASVTGRGRKRTVIVDALVDRSAVAVVRLLRGRSVLARRTFSVHRGVNRLRLRVPRGVSRGRARMVLAVSAAGTTRTVARSVRLGR